MPDPQLTPPFSAWRTGYQPPKFFDYQFRLTPLMPPVYSGWLGQTTNGQLFNPYLRLSDDTESSFTATCAAVARSAGADSCFDPRLAAATRFAAADSKLWDGLYGLLRGAGPGLWPDVPGRQKNIVTGRPVSIGKVDPSGVFRPTAADGVVAGAGIPLIPPDGISLGKRFLFANDPHVHFYLYLDKDAADRHADLLVAGSGIAIEGKTSSGNPLKLRIGAGRDQAGGGAGFIRIQIGPDYLPPAPQP